MSGYSLASSTWGSEEETAIVNLVKSGKLTMGHEVAMFEKEFASYFGARHAVMVNSGSSANLLAIAALTLKKSKPLLPGMEIIVPTVSWPTTYYPVHQYGLKLRFVDVSSDDLNINTSLIRDAINPNTGGIFAVNLLGQPCNLPALRKIANENEIYLIEDNCESMGATIGDKAAGTWGDLGTFSFYFSHHINTIEGGMILTDDDELRDVLISIRAHGWTRGLDRNNHVFNKTGSEWDDLFRFVLPGFNVRPMEIQGALGRIQLSKFSSFLRIRKSNHEYFVSKFKELDEIKIQSGVGETSSFGFSIIIAPESDLKRSTIIEALSSADIETRPIVAGNFLRNPVIKRMDVIASPENTVADWIHQNGFFLGNHHYDIRKEIDKAFGVINAAFRKRSGGCKRLLLQVSPAKMAVTLQNFFLKKAMRYMV